MSRLGSFDGRLCIVHRIIMVNGSLPLEAVAYSLGLAVPLSCDSTRHRFFEFDLPRQVLLMVASMLIH